MKSGWRNMANKFTDSIEEAESGRSDTVPGAADVFGLGNLPERRSRQVVEREVVVYQPDPNAIQRHDDGTMTYKRFTMTKVALIIPDDVTSDELFDVGQVVHGLHSSIQWIVGDLMNSMKRIWGDSYQRVAEQLGYEVKTVQEWASICRNVSIRMETLSFGHHQLVAPYTPDDQRKMLQWASENGASISSLRRAIAEWKRTEKPKQTKLAFSPAVTEGERHSYISLTRIRNAIKGSQNLTRDEVLTDAKALKQFAEQVIKDMGGE